jgi:hypothetical protein
LADRMDDSGTGELKKIGSLLACNHEDGAEGDKFSQFSCYECQVLQSQSRIHAKERRRQRLSV